MKTQDIEALKTLDRDDIALLIGQDISKWSDVKTQKESLDRLRSLADRIVDYAHLHYSVQMTAPMSQAKEWIEGSKPFILPGLPGSK